MTMRHPRWYWQPLTGRAGLLVIIAAVAAVIVLLLSLAFWWTGAGPQDRTAGVWAAVVLAGLVAARLKPMPPAQVATAGPWPPPSHSGAASGPARPFGDPEVDAVRQLQRCVLDRLRGGRKLFTAHKEGGSQVYFNGRVFVRSDYGDFPGETHFADDAAMLAFLRQFLDWEAKREAAPRQPSEREVWQFILNRLEK